MLRLFVMNLIWYNDAMETIPTNTQQLIELLGKMIDRQIQIELDGELPDMQWAMISMQYAKESLNNVWSGNTPEDYLRKYVKVLENRYNRIQDEDSGEYGSGRDALGAIIFAVEQILLSAGVAA